jgi:choline-sulfatase
MDRAGEGKGRRRPAVLLLLLFLVLAGGLWFFHLRPPRNDAEASARIRARKPAPQDLNLVIFTLDTTRADRLGCYGFKAVETPRIDGLAREGILFEHVTAAVPLTFPAHSSIFTGLIPPHHGVRDNGGFFLDSSKTALASRLKSAGYRTGAFIGAWVLESKWGLSQGFDTYSDKFDLSKYKVLSLGTVQKKGDEVMDGALEWLETVQDRKFFAWVHLYDPHAPYDPPEPYLSRYRKDPYLGEIAYTDHVVGRLLDWLKEKKLMGRTLIVLTADHGESLGEHGEAAHAFYIYDATTAVPLIIRTPWNDRGRCRTQVASVDIFPTILDLLGMAPQKGIDGRSLVRAVFDPSVELGHTAYSETYFPRYHFGWQHLRSFRSLQYKFIDAPTPELYALEKDPSETQNVYRAYSKRAQELRTALNALVGAASPTTPERQKLDPETLQRLAALGYVGNVGEVDPEAVLPDPKDKIDVFALMGKAREAAQQEDLDEAIAIMRRVIAQDPKIIDAHLTLGNWLVKTKRTDEAIDAFRKALALKPDNELAMINLAHVYRERGQAEAAIEGFRSALKLDPKSPQNWYQLATLYLDLGRSKDAESTFREALGWNPKMGSAYNSLGAIAFQRGDLDEAERLVQQALALEPRVPAGHFNLARIREARGDLAGAQNLYRQELEIYVDNGKARFNLAQLLRQRGDHEGYLRELKTGVDKAPEFGPCYFFLAREELGIGELDAAMDLARRGLAVDQSSEVSPLGHYVLADVYTRRGEHSRAQHELDAAHLLEASLRRRGSHAV